MIMSDLGNGGIKTFCNTKLMRTKKVSDTGDKLLRQIERNEIVGSYRGQLPAIIIDLGTVRSSIEFERFTMEARKQWQRSIVPSLYRCFIDRINRFQRGNFFALFWYKVSKLFDKNRTNFSKKKKIFLTESKFNWIIVLFRWCFINGPI